MKNVVFEHNTIMHTPKNQTNWDQGSMSHQDMLGMFFYADPGTGSSVSSVVAPTDVIVRNNLFIEPHNTSAGVWIGSGFAHNNNMFAPKTMALKDQVGGTFKLDATDILIDTVEALKLTADYRLGVGSPAIDKASTQGTMTYVDDIDLHKVPCESGPDIGASEYCDGQASIPHPPVGGISGGVDGGSTGQGGASGSSGAPGTGGATSPGGGAGAPVMGGAPGTGGQVGGGGNVGTGGSVIGSGGKSGSGGAVGSGGKVGAGGAIGSGGGAGGAAGNGGAADGGGSVSSGGNTASGGANGGSSKKATTKSCSCAIGGHGTPSSALLLLSLALVLPLLRRRR